MTVRAAAAEAHHGRQLEIAVRLGTSIVQTYRNLRASSFGAQGPYPGSWMELETLLTAMVAVTARTDTTFSGGLKDMGEQLGVAMDAASAARFDPASQETHEALAHLLALNDYLKFWLSDRAGARANRYDRGALLQAARERL